MKSLNHICRNPKLNSSESDLVDIRCSFNIASQALCIIHGHHYRSIRSKIPELLWNTQCHLLYILKNTLISLTIINIVPTLSPMKKKWNKTSGTLKILKSVVFLSFTNNYLRTVIFGHKLSCP